MSRGKTLAKSYMKKKLLINECKYPLFASLVKGFQFLYCFLREFLP